MAKVTQQDVVNFLKEKVTQLTKDLESAQNALNALQGSVTADAPVTRGRKPKSATAAPAAKRKSIAKPGGAKRGRKPKVKEVSAEAPAELTAEV
jgi:hypothetical protein